CNRCTPQSWIGSSIRLQSPNYTPSKASPSKRSRRSCGEIISSLPRKIKTSVPTLEAAGSRKSSTKMFKTRIRRWGLDKKHKAPEVLEMLRLKRERDAAGKESTFFVRGRRINWDDIELYVKRSRVLQAKIDSGFLEIGGHIPGVVCRTPSPDPAL